MGQSQSRRLGRSLGVNLCSRRAQDVQLQLRLLPVPAGPTSRTSGEFPRPADVIDALDAALQRDPAVDAITVAGNGEPTLHPAFAPIAEGLFRVRERRAPGRQAGAAVERLDARPPRRRLQPQVFDARYMKLDAGDATTFRLMNGPPLPLAG